MCPFSRSPDCDQKIVYEIAISPDSELTPPRLHQYPPLQTLPTYICRHVVLLLGGLQSTEFRGLQSTELRRLQPAEQRGLQSAEYRGLQPAVYRKQQSA